MDNTKRQRDCSGDVSTVVVHPRVVLFEYCRAISLPELDHILHSVDDLAEDEYNLEWLTIRGQETPWGTMHTPLYTRLHVQQSFPSVGVLA